MAKINKSAAMFEENLYQLKLKNLQTIMSILIILVASKSNQHIVNFSQPLCDTSNDTAANLNPINEQQSPCSEATNFMKPTFPLAFKRILAEESSNNQTEDLMVQESQSQSQNQSQSTLRFLTSTPEQIVEPIVAPFFGHTNNDVKNKNIAEIQTNYDNSSSPSSSTSLDAKSKLTSQEPQYFKPPDEFLANYWLQDNQVIIKPNESSFKPSAKYYPSTTDSHQENQLVEQPNLALSNHFFIPSSSRQAVNTSSSLPSDLIASLSTFDKPEKHLVVGLTQSSTEQSAPANYNLNGFATYKQTTSSQQQQVQSQQQRLLSEQLNLQKINNDLIRLASDQFKLQQQQHNYGYQQFSKQMTTRRPQTITTQKLPPYHNQYIFPNHQLYPSHQQIVFNPKMKHVQFGKLLPFTNKLRYKKFNYRLTTTGRPFMVTEDLQTSAHSQDIQLSPPKDMLASPQYLHSIQSSPIPPAGSFQAPISFPHQALDSHARLTTKANSNNNNINYPIFTKYTGSNNSRQLSLQSLVDSIDPSASALLLSAPSTINLSSPKSRIQRYESINAQLPSASGLNPQGALDVGDQNPSTMSYSLLPSNDSPTDSLVNDNSLTGLDQDQFIKALQQSATLATNPQVPEVAQEPASVGGGSTDAALASIFEAMLKNAISNTTSNQKPSEFTSQNSNNAQSSSQLPNQYQPPSQQLQAQQSNTNFLANQSPHQISPPKLAGQQQQSQQPLQQMGYPGQMLAFNHQGAMVPPQPPAPIMGDDGLHHQQLHQQAQTHHQQLYGPGSPDSLQSADNNYQQYDQPPNRKRKKNKKRKSGSKQPQIRVAKKPRTGSGNPGFYDANSQNDLEPSATFHKWKYPWLYGPNAGFRPDDDEEEEGETEVNIRFFNNFSRMGPFGQLTRAGGTATLVVSLAFLIISNISLAATVIAHGISSFLRNHGAPDRTKNVVRKRETTNQPDPQKALKVLNLFSHSNLGSLRFRAKTSSTTTTTTTTTSTTTTAPPSIDLNEKIKSFGREWET